MNPYLVNRNKDIYIYNIYLTPFSHRTFNKRTQNRNEKGWRNAYLVNQFGFENKKNSQKTENKLRKYDMKNNNKYNQHTY